MALLKEASPIHRIDKTTGPMFLANSLDEITPTDGVERLQHALTENAIQSTVKFVSGHGHGEAYMYRAQEPTLAFFDEFLA